MKHMVRLLFALAAVAVARAQAVEPTAIVVPAARLIDGTARDLAEYQRLTAEGKLGDAGQRLEAVKRKLDQLARRSR